MSPSPYRVTAVIALRGGGGQRVHDLADIKYQNNSIAKRGDAFEVVPAQSDDGIARWPGRLGRNAGELPCVVGHEADAAALNLHDQQTGPEVDRGTVKPEPRTKVDDWHDLTAREHHALHARRRVRYDGHVFHHLHVKD